MNGHVSFVGIPPLVARSLCGALSDRGVAVVEHGADGALPADPYVEVVWCFRNKTEGWARLKALPPGRLGCVALFDSDDAEQQQRALRLGAAVIHLGFAPDVAAEVILARARGDLIAPAGVIAAILKPSSERLEPGEQQILPYFLEGLNASQIAARTCYSERHVRRLIQSLMMKAGTSDRSAAADYYRSETAVPA